MKMFQVDKALKIYRSKNGLDSYITYFILLISYDGQNGVLSSKSNGKDNKFEENFLIICEYFNFVKNMLFSLKYV
jgi:hypothetical protein